jgi:hypothetical protein
VERYLDRWVGVHCLGEAGRDWREEEGEGVNMELVVFRRAALLLSSSSSMVSDRSRIGDAGGMGKGAGPSSSTKLLLYRCFL